MRDNSIHWFNLIAQSDFYWNHIQIFSLSAFLNTLLGTSLPSFTFKLPLLIGVIASLGIGLFTGYKKRMEAAILLVAALSLTFFLSYNTVWEYQFTSVLPLMALFILVRNQEKSSIKKMSGIVLISGAFLYLPTLYFLYGSPNKITLSDFSIIRFNRTVPIIIMYMACMIQLIQLYVGSRIKE